MLTRTSVLLCLLLLSQSPVWAATYYVAPTGSDRASCGNAQRQATPRQTINAGIACLRGGGTLIVKAGTDNEIIPETIPSGTANAPTIVKADPPRGAVLQSDG